MNRSQAEKKATSDLNEDGIFATHAARVLDDAKCQNILVLDVRGISQLTDYLVLATGTSDRQMRSAVDDLEVLTKEDKQTLFRMHGESGSSWVVADFANVIVHLFTAEARMFYDMESLWSDGRTIDWKPLTQAGQFAHLGPGRRKRNSANAVDSAVDQE